MASIDRYATITALRADEFPCLASKRRILRLSASFAAGILADLHDTVFGLDHDNIAPTLIVIPHASEIRHSAMNIDRDAFSPHRTNINS